MKIISLFLFLFSIVFLSLKLPHLSIRLSDTNVYFYTALEILNLQLLYKDIFFTNFPLFPYISSLYQLLTFGSVKLFYATALLEVIIITSLIFFIVFNKTKNHLVSTISSLLYIFSTIVLVTSDHQIGVFTASIFIIISYIFLEKKNYLFSGIFAGLALLTKAYFLPITAAFTIYILFVKRDYKHLFNFFTGFAITTTATLLPFIFLSNKEFITDVFYSTTRSGDVKQSVIWNFIHTDFILFSVFIFNLFNYKKNKLFSIISLTSILFLFFYQGLYYIYLNFIIPFLALSFYNLSDFLTHKKPLLNKVLPIIMLFAIIINISLYIKQFANLEVIKEIDSISEIIKKEKPEYLYGTPDITPVLSYLSKVPLLDNIIDTNPNAFRKKIFNSKNLTQKAVGSRTIIVARGTDKLTIDNSAINEIFDRDLVDKYCKPILSIPIKTKSKSSRIHLLKCY